MKKLARYLLAAALSLAVLAGASIKWDYGDLRYAVANHTMRHWNIVEAVKPACAAGLIPGGGFPCSSGSSYALSGPASDTIAVASTYTLTPNGATTATVTPSDNGHGGVFNPTSISFTGDNSPQTFTYTPRQSSSNPGLTLSLSTTNTGGLTDPSPLNVTVSNILNGYPGFTGTGNSGWQNNDVNRTSGTSDPFGGTSAQTMTEDTVAQNHYIFQHVTITASSQHIISEIVAPGTGTRNAGIEFVDSTFADWFGIIINPSTCTLVSTLRGGGATIGTPILSSVGGGYCLIQVSGSLGTYSGDAQWFSMLANGTTTNYTGDGSSSLKIYGPVLQ